MRFTSVALAVFFASTITAGCYNDKYDKLYPSVPTCDTTSIKYTTDIAPIISSNCYSPGNGCHDAAGASASGFDYTNFNVLVANVVDGSLLSDINWQPTARHNNMPKNGAKLSQCDINKITRWVNEGHPNN